MAKKRIETPKVKKAYVVAYETAQGNKLTNYFVPAFDCDNAKKIINNVNLVPPRKDGKQRSSMTQKMMDDVIMKFFLQGVHLEFIVKDVKKLDASQTVEVGHVFKAGATDTSGLIELD